MTARGVIFTSSPAYGQTVVLGPVQRDLLALILDLTANGRRPELTLAELARRLGRAVSSVHEAIGRLRALGLIGFAARMGRRGGHRLWRVDRPATGRLDPAKHRRAIGRIIGRYHRSSAMPALEVAAAEPTDELDSPPSSSVNPKTRDQDGDRLHDNPDPFSVGRPDAGPLHGGRGPAPRRASFGELMRWGGIGPWIDERTHGR